MDLTFLEATTPLTKTFVKEKSGNITKTPYPFVWEFTSHAVQCNTLTAMHAELVRHAALGHCLLKGNVTRPLVKESRAGSTESNAATEWAVLDLDGLPDSYLGVPVTINSFLADLGLSEVSHIIQWSASYGIENKKLRAHVFFMLDKPTAAPLIKQALIQLNHTTPVLDAAMGLTKTGNTISWPLDVSACQNDKLIYIAPPVLRGLKDPLAGKSRIELVKRKLDRLPLAAAINSATQNKALTDKRLDALREAAGLPKRKTTFKMHGSLEILVKPDVCTITDIKYERDFVYFNLNGGDSWAYYHPENNPDYIYNFKGEPAYLTKELLPEYWSDLHKASSRPNSRGQTLLAFSDRKTAAYWVGTSDTATGEVSINVVKNETQVRHFAKENGLALGDFIPQWDLVFDPHSPGGADFTNKTVNTFMLSPYMAAQAKQVKQCPKTILKVIDHVLGSDPDITKHFINWIATILQTRDRTRTAWVWHGVPGTGKGMLFEHVLRPIFGKDHTTQQNMETLSEKFNHWMQKSFLVFVDEVQLKALQNEKGVVAKLKSYITEPSIPIREMNRGAQEVTNYTNWILASNMPDVVQIEEGDRRFNVAKYQPHKLQITEKEVEQLGRELQAFHDYLLYYPIDKRLAGTVLDTTDRRTMISISESSVDTVSNAILAGNFGFLMEQLPSSTTNVSSNVLEFNKVEDYKAVLKALLARTDPRNGACNISRDELRIIFNYVVGNMPTTPNKFTSLLKHHRVHVVDVWINTGTTAGKERGIGVTWTDLAQWQSYLDVFTPPAAKVRALKKSGGKLAIV